MRINIPGHPKIKLQRFIDSQLDYFETKPPNIVKEYPITVFDTPTIEYLKSKNIFEYKGLRIVTLGFGEHKSIWVEK